MESVQYEDYIVSNGKMTKETDMNLEGNGHGLTTVLHGQLYSKENHEKTSVRVVGVPARISPPCPRKQIYNVIATPFSSVTPSDVTRRITTAFILGHLSPIFTLSPYVLTYVVNTSTLVSTEGTRQIQVTYTQRTKLTKSSSSLWTVMSV